MAKVFTTVDGSNTKIRAEQIKSELALGTLAGDIAALTQSFADIIGGDWNADLADYQNVQLKDLAAQIDAGTSGLFKVKVAAEVTGTLSSSAGMTAASFDAAGKAHVGSAQVDNLNVAGGLVFADASGNLDNDAKVAWNGTALIVDGTVSGSAVKIAGDVAQRLYIVDADGSMKDESGLVYDGSKLAVTGIVSGSGALQGASVAVDGAVAGGELRGANLTAGRVVFVGASNDALVDDGEMTYSAGVLTVSGSTFSRDVTIAGNLIVSGDTITANVGELLVEDKNIVVGKDASLSMLSDAGLYVSSSASAHSLLWQYNGGAGAEYWDMSDELRVPDLRIENVVSAKFLKTDADGDVSAGTLVDFGAMLDTQLVAGTGVTLSAADAGGFVTASIGQAVGTGDSVTFANITDSALTVGAAVKATNGGLLTSAGWDDFFTVEPNKGLSITQEGFKVALSQSQDLRQVATPTFAALNLGSAGVVSGSGDNLVISGTVGKLYLADEFVAGSTWSQMLGISLSDSAAEWSAFEIAFGEKSLIAAITQAGSATGAVGKYTEVISGNKAADEAFAIAGLSYTAVGDVAKKLDFFLNGQLMVSGSSADYVISSTNSVAFKFALENGDVVTAIVR